MQKLKDARAEAAKEIESYRAQKQKEYESFEAEVCCIPLLLYVLSILIDSSLSAATILTHVSLETLETKHKSQTSSSQSEIDKDTENQLSTLKSSVEKNRSSVVDKILERVTKVEPTLHKNLTKVEN